MNFTNHLQDKLASKNLLNHPFYAEWNAGTIPLETLRLYARQYEQHVGAFPRYLSATHSLCPNAAARQVLLENLIEEERGAENHPELWIRFLEGLGGRREDVASEKALPETKHLVETFMTHARRSYAAGLGALFAYEHQIPKIAEFKIRALQEMYGIKEERTLEFFQVHREADVLHTQALSELLEALSPAERKEAEEAAQASASALWGFLDGIRSQQVCAHA